MLAKWLYWREGGSFRASIWLNVLRTSGSKRLKYSISDGNPEKVIEKLSKEAKYFYMDKDDKSDFIVFILDGNTLEIYESYR